MKLLLLGFVMLMVFLSACEARRHQRRTDREAEKEIVQKPKPKVLIYAPGYGMARTSHPDGGGTSPCTTSTRIKSHDPVWGEDELWCFENLEDFEKQFEKNEKKLGEDGYKRWDLPDSDACTASTWYFFDSGGFSAVAPAPNFGHLARQVYEVTKGSYDVIVQFTQDQSTLLSLIKKEKPVLITTASKGLNDLVSSVKKLRTKDGVKTSLLLINEHMVPQDDLNKLAMMDDVLTSLVLVNGAKDGTALMPQKEPEDQFTVPWFLYINAEDNHNPRSLIAGNGWAHCTKTHRKKGTDPYMSFLVAAALSADFGTAMELFDADDNVNYARGGVQTKKED